MTATTSFAARARASLRDALLDAATELLIEHGFAGLRMADVGSLAGVSRQTVYNEFGDKRTLVTAVAMRTAEEFSATNRERYRQAGDAISGIRAAVAHTMRYARENRLVAAVIGSPEARDLLPWLTTDATPVLRICTGDLSVELRARMPELSAEHAELLAETSVRLSISYLLLPGGDAEHAANAVCAVLEPALRQFQST
ncbi:TetR family transcriptional regulator [Tamaricihabitans halophyticus]|uniref:TetR family transcriptional regulator n=1 Tax=Tamaricihabitans halophyticus TaxID=1262583 RepID=A0A4R2R486_9PSEU|nr:TetR family transcriptional regulator [Tamaricihabitans halophyticus]TCP56559.1 TetR family transcriptional regulator [Tamaricihabitans halophyticus]